MLPDYCSVDDTKEHILLREWDVTTFLFHHVGSASHFVLGVIWEAGLFSDVHSVMPCPFISFQLISIQLDRAKRPVDIGYMERKERTDPTP